MENQIDIVDQAFPPQKPESDKPPKTDPENIFATSWYSNQLINAVVANAKPIIKSILALRRMDLPVKEERRLLRFFLETMLVIADDGLGRLSELEAEDKFREANPLEANDIPF